MRPDGDRRPAAQVKLRHLRRLRDELSIDLLVDDDPMVVDAARALGFTARLAGWTPQPTDGGIAASHERHRLRNTQERDGRT